MQVSESNENEVLMEENSFSAPTRKGVYYYSYGVWWMIRKRTYLMEMLFMHLF